MVNYYSGDPKRIQHFVKVHSFAKLIAELEKVSPEILLTVETAALVHDIGIKIAENQYRTSTDKLQEQLGPPEAEKMLNALNFNQSLIERICYLVGHHHTYDTIDELDYQILIEADFLVNIYEGQLDSKTIHQLNKNIFKTKSGKILLEDMFKTYLDTI